MTASKGARLIGYARVSADDQNLDRQRAALLAAGVAPGDIYADRRSGAAAHRRGLEAAFRELRAGDVLVVWKLDRLGRSLPALVRFMEDVRGRGAQLRVLAGTSIDTSAADGELIHHVFAALAEFERDLDRERVVAGRASAGARGRAGGRQPAMTPERVRKARELLKAGVPAYKAAPQIGVSKALLYQHRKRILEEDDD